MNLKSLAVIQLKILLSEKSTSNLVFRPIDRVVSNVFLNCSSSGLPNLSGNHLH